MDTLAFGSRSTAVTRPVAGGSAIVIAQHHLALCSANPSRLAPGVLPTTYSIKPLIRLANEDLFGELVVLRLLEKDGWSGVWVDTFHDRGKGKLFWTDMPHRSEPFDLASSPIAAPMYKSILSERGGKAGGFFDVLAWKDEQLLFVEYKGPRDHANANEPLWLEAALKCGVTPEQLLYVKATIQAGIPADGGLSSEQRERKQEHVTGINLVGNADSTSRRPAGGLHRRKISKALQTGQQWRTESRVDGYVDVWPPREKRGDATFATLVKEAVIALGYSPTVAWHTRSDDVRVVRVRTPETVEQAGRGGH